LPGSKSSKTVKVAERKRLRNRSIRTNVKTHIVKAERLIGAGEDSAHQETVAAISSIDNAVNKGVFHRNKGARLKSRLMKKLNAVVAVSQSSEYSEEEAEQSQGSGG